MDSKNLTGQESVENYSLTVDYAALTATTNYSVSATEVVKNWAALCVLPIVAFVATGNVLVILAVKMDHKLRSSTNYFLTSLAVADLLVAITVMPPSLAMIINNYAWPFPDSLCGIWQMLDVCFSTASILHLCMISLDRYLALAKPFRYSGGGWMSRHSSSTGGWATDKRGNSKWMGSGLGGGASKLSKRVAKRILLVWVVSLGISLPLPILGHQDRNNIFIREMCVINIPEFTIYGSLVAFFLPLVVMFITYSLTIRTLQKQSKLVKCIMGKNGSSTHRGRPSLTSRQSLKMTSTGSVGSARSVFGKRLSSAVSDGRNPPTPDIWTTKKRYSERADSAVSGISFQTSYTEGKIKTCALLCCFASEGSEPAGELESELMRSEYEVKRKSARADSDNSDSESTQNQPIGVTRSPILARANMTFSKVVSKLPINRLSTNRLSATVKSRAIATEQRASKVLGMIFTLFCVFWCPFFITNTCNGICERYDLKCDLELMGNLMNWFVWVGYVSSGVNPCVYTLFSRQFRETFRMLVCCQWRDIGRRNFQRNYSRERGFSTSSFRHDVYSTDSRDATLRSEASSSMVRIGAEERSHRRSRESIVFRQQKRIQVTGSVDSAALLREISPTLRSEGRETSRHQSLQWRSTWHHALCDNEDCGYSKSRRSRVGSKMEQRLNFQDSTGSRCRGRRRTLDSYASIKDRMALQDSIAEDGSDSEDKEIAGKSGSVTFATHSSMKSRRKQQGLVMETEFSSDVRRARFQCGSDSSDDENENNNNLNNVFDDSREHKNRRLLHNSPELRVQFSLERPCKSDHENKINLNVFDDSPRHGDRRMLRHSPRTRVRFSLELPCKACADRGANGSNCVPSPSRLPEG